MALILVDSSVWIDLLRDVPTVQTMAVRQLVVSGHRLLLGDLVLTEVLQGTRSERAFGKAHAFLSDFDFRAIADRQVSVAAARNYRKLRERGVTIRKTIDTLIATRCIVDGIPLLYSDRDFDPFVEHLGLISALEIARGGI